MKGLHTLPILTLSIAATLSACGGGGETDNTGNTANTPLVTAPAIGGAETTAATDTNDTTSANNTDGSATETNTAGTTSALQENTNSEMDLQTVEAITTPTEQQQPQQSGYQATYQTLPQSLRILYVGNSYMAYTPEVNGSPSSYGAYHQINSLLQLSGIEVTPVMRSIGGGTLEQHWQEGDGTSTPRGLIQSGDFDLLIMQGRYDIHESNSKAARFNTYADRFATLAKENNMQVLIYGLWAADYWISPEGDTFGPVAHDIYRNAAERNAVSYAPNGLAYTELYNRLANVLSEQEIEDTLTQDTVHPAPSVAYLAANVVHYTLLGIDSPSMDTYRPPGISDDLGSVIRSIARETVSNHAYSWR